jgi:hypothetical protein
MDAFEQVIANVLANERFWVMRGYKVELTKAEKVLIGRWSAPRWEIDIVAYSPGLKLCYAMECKSYLDSRGVQYLGMQSGATNAKRYKLFNEPVLRKTVLKRLKMQLVKKGMVTRDTGIRLGLAAGKVSSAKDDGEIAKWFAKERWLYWSPATIRGKLVDMCDNGYSDDVSLVTAKLIERGRAT